MAQDQTAHQTDDHIQITTAWPESSRGLNAFSIDQRQQRLLRWVLDHDRAAIFPDATEAGPDDYAALFNDLESFGAWVGGPLEEQACYSDRHAPPVLTHPLSDPGRPGARDSRVVYNPLYTTAQREGYRRGVIADGYGGVFRSHFLSFLKGYNVSKSDIGTHCPETLTGAVAYILDHFAPVDVRAAYLPQILSCDGTARTGGTWLTERHSGTNAGATTCVVRPDEHGVLRAYGEKWFASNAGSDMALIIARPDGAVDGHKGVGLYLLPDAYNGVPNLPKILALKDKMGTRGLATAELDLNGCAVVEIVPPPHGMRVMMEALNYSRVHNAMAAAGVTHRAFVEAMCWADNRKPDGKKPLSTAPLVQEDLIALLTEWAASFALAGHASCRMAAAVADGGMADPATRLVIALAKWRTAESAVQSAKTALELVGGNGYTADWPVERLLRDAMVLPVWEGPKQVQALEFARVVLTYPGTDADIVGILGAGYDTLPDGVADLRRAISRELRDMQHRLRLLRADPSLSHRAATGLMRHAADILTLSLLAQEAARDLATYGDDATLLLARHFHEACFGERHGLQLAETPLQQAFRRVAGMPVMSVPAPGPVPRP